MSFAGRCGNRELKCLMTALTPLTEITTVGK